MEMERYIAREQRLQALHLYRVQEWFFQNADGLGDNAQAAKTLLENFVLTCNAPHEDDYTNYRRDISSFPELQRELLLQGFRQVYGVSPDELPPGTDFETREFAMMSEWLDHMRNPPAREPFRRFRHSPKFCGGRFLHRGRTGWSSY